MRARYKTTLYHDVLHAALNDDGKECDAFFFTYGAVVFWGVSAEIGKKFLENEKALVEGRKLSDIEMDEFTYIYGDTPKVIEDEITLPDQNILSKLAVSHGIAQSLRLSCFETSLQRTFELSKKIPEDLAKYGEIPLSRKEIRCRMGELFITRNSINLNMEVLGAPEFFWEYPELEPLYSMIAKYLDIRSRVEVLNQRLNIIHELYEMLGNELNHSHSSRLEWIIIWLIVIEVIVTLGTDVFHIL
jgi:uncharacterized Rmd1/YagE family protein